MTCLYDLLCYLDSRVEVTQEISIDDLLGDVDRTAYYRYNGSLTTPSCNEAVVWTIFKKPIKVDRKWVGWILGSSWCRLNVTIHCFKSKYQSPLRFLAFLLMRWSSWHYSTWYDNLHLGAVGLGGLWKGNGAPTDTVAYCVVVLCRDEPLCSWNSIQMVSFTRDYVKCVYALRT